MKTIKFTYHYSQIEVRLGLSRLTNQGGKWLPLELLQHIRLKSACYTHKDNGITVTLKAPLY